MPVPAREIVRGEPEALLAIETLPVKLPLEPGAKRTLSVAVDPGAMLTGTANPLMLKPAPEAVAPEMVTLELPLLVRVTGNVLLLPAFTFPKLKVVGLACSE